MAVGSLIFVPENPLLVFARWSLKDCGELFSALF
jgi:hypothetical protein